MLGLPKTGLPRLSLVCHGLCIAQENIRFRGIPAFSRPECTALANAGFTISLETFSVHPKRTLPGKTYETKCKQTLELNYTQAFPSTETALFRAISVFVFKTIFYCVSGQFHQI